MYIKQSNVLRNNNIRKCHSNNYTRMYSSMDFVNHLLEIEPNTIVSYLIAKYLVKLKLRIRTFGFTLRLIFFINNPKIIK